jgi:1-deoxy-D-xylulose-5-phosphate synthase
MKDLEEYNFPEDLKKMNDEEQELLAVEIREFLLEHVSRTGGHLASNLGVVELTIALHRVFDSPRDKIIWDVGHQSYVHKILTGRADEFDSLRQTGGMSGFPKRRESEHDIYETGHASTSISAAAGFAAARDIKGEDYSVVAVIGDGSMTGGMTYEALNNIGSSKQDVIVILNDNGMSISKNTGGMSLHLRKLRTSSRYLNAKRSVKKKIGNIPEIGKRTVKTISGMKNWLKYGLLSGMPGGIIFEELGFTYLGPVNGHNIREIETALEEARNVKGPVLLHVMTKKGKGYRNAEEDPDKFHGIGPFDIDTGKEIKKSETTYSKVFGKAVLDLGEKHSEVTTVSAAMRDATGLGGFAAQFPKRFFDVGIAEEHAVTFAAGMAANGMRPVVAIYSSFLQRSYDQILEDVCLQGLPVIFGIDRAGIVGADGETHHGLFDLCYMTDAPGMTVLAPSNGDMLYDMMEFAYDLGGPAAIRYPRGGCSYGRGGHSDFDGRPKRLRSGKDVDIWSVGNMTDHAVKAAEILAERGIDAGVVDVRLVKPLDLTLIESGKPVYTIEDGIAGGGFGAKMAEALPGEDVRVLGWPDEFIPHGSCDDLYRKYGLDPESVADRIAVDLDK